MAEPIPFPEQNCNLVAAPGDEELVSELPVHRDDANGQFISKWRFTTPELEEIARTGCVYIHVMAQRQPPVCVTAISPFKAS